MRENTINKKYILIWQIAGFIFISLVGSILHFLYEWSNCIIVAPFSAINESTWEHMKLLFFPSLVFAIVQSFFIKSDNYWSIKLKGIIIGSLLIPTMFYTYIGIIGRSYGVINIAIFFIASLISLYYEYKLFIGVRKIKTNDQFSLLILIIIAILYITFTFFPPRIALFQDPITKGYGIFG